MVRKKSKQGAHLKGASTSRFNGENKSSREWLDSEDDTRRTRTLSSLTVLRTSPMTRATMKCQSKLPKLYARAQVVRAPGSG